MDNGLHSAAEVGFSRSPELYDRSRSGYPRPLIERLFRHLGLQEQSRILELGAGTGKLTEALTALNPNVTAVEPLKAMREALAAKFPGVRVLDAIAEAVPLPAGSVDFVFAGTAYHWFHPEEAYSELLRLLRPGGGVGLLWTSWWSADDFPDWYAEVRNLIRPFEGDTPRYKHMKWREPYDRGAEFQMLQFERHDISRLRTVEEVRDRLLSVSYVSALPELVFNALKREIEKRLQASVARGAVLRLPEELHLYWTFRKA